MVLDLDVSLIWAAAVPGALLVLKLVFGVAGALKEGAFDVRKLPGFLAKDVLPYMVPLVAMGALAVAVPQVKAIYLAASGTYVLKLVADMKDTIAKFYDITASE